MPRLPTLLLCIPLALTSAGGPVEFGRQELQSALEERKTKPTGMRVQSELSTDPPESFRILPGRVTGGDLRGLMYGLLEAADQVRRKGQLAAAKGTPALQVRGVRMLVRAGQGTEDWIRSPQFWQAQFEAMARTRLNRVNLFFAGQEGLPGDVETLALISKTAAEYAVELALGFRVKDLAQPGAGGELSRGPSTLMALKELLASCPSVRSVQFWLEPEDEAWQAPFCRDWLFRAIRESGRRVSLELRVSKPSSESVTVAKEAGLPLRLGMRYGESGRGAATSLAGAEELWQFEADGGFGGQQLRNPVLVRRVMQECVKAKCAGMEFDAPEGGAPPDAALYRMWGRLAYDPSTPETAWRVPEARP